MFSKYILAPSILSADFTKLGKEIKITESAGADWIHIDVMDGHFVPNLTVGPLVVEACRRATNLPLDVHLMMERPEGLLDDFAQAGANYLTVQVETCPHLHRALSHIQSLGCQAGVALNPSTPAILIQPILHMVDLVLVMSVNPGYSGQLFIPETLPKITQIRKWLEEVNPDGILQVDGGINAETITRVLEAGAQAFVAASAIYNHPQGIQAGIQALKDQIALYQK
ncbi:MAG: ribulose-phosphate 3-epimerase [Chloroflexota bacterium]